MTFCTENEKSAHMNQYENNANTSLALAGGIKCASCNEKPQVCLFTAFYNMYKKRFVLFQLPTLVLL